MLLVAAGVWWAARPAPGFGNAAAPRALATGATGAPDLPAPSAADSGALGAVPTRPATLPTAADPVVAPIRLVIPTLRLTARITPVGVAADGQFDVPPSVDTVG
jgi:hypothetical protein